MKILIWIAFSVVVAAQWYVPLSLVTKSEQTLEGGKEFRFRTQPIDPSDPFRGKYITLSFEASAFKLRDTLSHIYEPGEVVFASIGVDSAGYALIDSLYIENPDDPSLTILKTRVGYSYIEPEGAQSIDVNFPFERLYLEESKASDAERIYWENQRARNDSTNMTTTYALVRIRDGHAVLVDVMIDERSIVDIVREMNKDVE